MAFRCALIGLAGRPNVGKSTLLSKLTQAKPAIANYEFTTRRLNLGYAKIGHYKIQFIDTPGTLARFEKMNEIEKQAHLALKYLADLIVLVIDPTGKLQEQRRLLDQLKSLDKEMISYLSKTDIAKREAIETAAKGINLPQKNKEELLEHIRTLL